MGDGDADSGVTEGPNNAPPFGAGGAVMAGAGDGVGDGDSPGANVAGVALALGAADAVGNGVGGPWPWRGVGRLCGGAVFAGVAV